MAPRRFSSPVIGLSIAVLQTFVHLRPSLLRTKQDRIVALGAPYRISAKRVAGDVREVRGGDREIKPASRGASLRTSRSTAADDPSRSGTGHGAGDRGVPGQSSTIC